MLERRVPDQGLPFEPEPRDPVAEVLDGVGGGGADGLAELPEGTTRRRWQRGEVCAHLSGGAS